MIPVRNYRGCNAASGLTQDPRRDRQNGGWMIQSCARTSADVRNKGDKFQTTIQGVRLQQSGRSAACDSERLDFLGEGPFRSYIKATYVPSNPLIIYVIKPPIIQSDDAVNHDKFSIRGANWDVAIPNSGQIRPTLESINGNSTGLAERCRTIGNPAAPNAFHHVWRPFRGPPRRTFFRSIPGAASPPPPPQFPPRPDRTASR